MAFYRTSFLKVEPVEPCQMCNYGTRYAKKEISNIDPKFMYSVVSGLHGDAPNQNGDYFRWEDELLRLRPDQIRVYATWIEKPNLLNHDAMKIVGKIVDTWPIKGEKSVDMLLATEKAGNTWLVKKVEALKIRDVSMGCSVEYSLCSECGNMATNETEWCEHLHPNKLNLKGKKSPKTGNMVYEDNRGVTGMEVSWITFGEGADPCAKTKQVLAKRAINWGAIREIMRSPLNSGA
jgi:hypothetical protein